tara:strand:- start:230 stop:379 length:150 start_codon:yes stop_codon:yes gene_type:complete
MKMKYVHKGGEIQVNDFEGERLKAAKKDGWEEFNAQKKAKKETKKADKK